MPFDYSGNPSNVLTLTATIGGVTSGPNSSVSTGDHGFTTGDQVYITGVLGIVGVNNSPGTFWTVTVTGLTTFTINNGSTIGTYSGGGTATDASPNPPVPLVSTGDTPIPEDSVDVSLEGLADLAAAAWQRLASLAQGIFTAGVFPNTQTVGVQAQGRLGGAGVVATGATDGAVTGSTGANMQSGSTSAPGSASYGYPVVGGWPDPAVVGSPGGYGEGGSGGGPGYYGVGVGAHSGLRGDGGLTPNTSGVFGIGNAGPGVSGSGSAGYSGVVGQGGAGAAGATFTGGSNADGADVTGAGTGLMHCTVHRAVLSRALPQSRGQYTGAAAVHQIEMLLID